MISVTDVYCMYNRARGLELVSPDDVVSACQLFESLDLPMRYIFLIINFKLFIYLFIYYKVKGV